MLLNSIKGSFNVVTGCGTGLGKSTLQWLLKNGSGPILAIDKKFEPNFVESLNYLDTKQKDELLIKTHDTFNEELAEASLSEFVGKYGRIDNLINVAGVALAFALHAKENSTNYDLEHVNNLLDFNTVGTFNMIRLASKYMIDENVKLKKKKLSKCIINASCISTTSPNIGQSFQAASKAAIESMTLCIARELAPFNIRCNTIRVGYFDTKLLHFVDERIPGYIAQHISLCPRKLGHPDEFAHLVQTIIENQMLNGACIKIDAGAKEVF